MGNIIEISIVGQLSPRLYGRFETIFSKNKESNILLFCDRSSFDIPIGTHFRQIETISGDVVFSGDIVLVLVTQQWGRKMSEIPKGWTTICSFRYGNGETPSIILSLPKLMDWSSNKLLVFKN